MNNDNCVLEQTNFRKIFSKKNLAITRIHKSMNISYKRKIAYLWFRKSIQTTIVSLI